MVKERSSGLSRQIVVFLVLALCGGCWAQAASAEDMNDDPGDQSEGDEGYFSYGDQFDDQEAYLEELDEEQERRWQAPRLGSSQTESPVSINPFSLVQELSTAARGAEPLLSSKRSERLLITRPAASAGVRCPNEPCGRFVLYSSR